MAAADFKPVEAVQAAAIARRYYLDDRSQKDTADEFGLSRFRVARILDRAASKNASTSGCTVPRNELSAIG